jgi:uncharacterized membrane protein
MKFKNQIFKNLIHLNFFFFLFFLSAFFILLNFKIYNLRSTYYDLGFYLDYYLGLVNNNFNYLFNSNFQLFSLLIFPLLKILPIKFWTYFLIFFQSFCLSLPILFLKNNIYFICVYLFSSVLWFVALTDFHPDVLIVPIMFYLDKISYENKFNVKILFLFLIILSIKLIYIFLVLGYLLYFYFNKFNFRKIYIYLFFLFIVVYLFIYFYNINTLTKNNMLDLYSSIFTFHNFYKIFSSKDILLTIFVLFSSSAFLAFYNLKKLLIILPLMLVYIILPVDSYKKYYYHYYAPIFPIFIIIFTDVFDYFIKKYSYVHKKFLFLIIPFISNFIFSPSPISYSFLFSYKWAFEHKAYFIDHSIYLTRIKLNELLITHSKNKSVNIMIENNVFFTELINKNIIIKVFPHNLEFNDFDFIILRSSAPHYIIDKICEDKHIFTCSNYDFINNYESYRKKISFDFFELYKDKNIIILKNTRFK